MSPHTLESTSKPPVPTSLALPPVRRNQNTQSAIQDNGVHQEVQACAEPQPRSFASGSWVIPPQTDAEFVAHMEQVLDTYAQLYDPACPVVCMDEQPVQLVKETRPPIAATQARPRRVDYEYERAGTASVFLFSEPLAGWRQATARARRTKADWAVEVAGLLEGRYAECRRSRWCATTSTRTRREPFMKYSSRPGHAKWSVASSSATRQNTGAG